MCVLVIFTVFSAIFELIILELENNFSQFTL